MNHDRMMFNKIVFGSIWLGFVGYAFLLAPPDRADSFELIVKLSTGNWAGTNPAIVALFNLMGILPMVYACLMLIDGKTQKLPAGLFSAASFAVGAFAILPYLALRVSNSTQVGDRRGIIKLLDSRWSGIILTIGTVVLLTYGIAQGNWTDFVRQWHTSRFIHVMSLDFCLLTLLLPVLITDDIDRRNFTNPQLVKRLSLLPLLGGLLYLCIRPNLTSSTSISDPDFVN